MLPRAVPAVLRAGLAVLSLSAVALTASPARAYVVAPPNFVIDSYAPGAGFVTPTTLAFFSDGRLLVGEKRGRVWIVQNGVKLSPPVIAIDNEVLDDNDRGLLCVAIDPNFATNRYIYLLYTVDPDTNGVDTNLEAFSRLTRYTLNASNVADPASRTILIGIDWPSGFPIGSPSHSIGSLRWGQDGSLLVSCGDGADFNSMDPGGHYPNLFLPGRANPYEDIGAFRAQSLSSIAGKVLRINPATGGGYPSNPYWDGNAFSKRSRIWEYGLRNPFRIQVRPNTGNANPTAGDPGTLYIGDVGWGTWEELNVAPGGGMNFGWPCYEGRLSNSAYQAATPAHNGCGSVGTADNPTSPTLPPLAWNHSNANVSTPPGYVGNTSTGGVFYTGSLYPSQFRGAMFFCDYGASWIRVATFDANDQFISLQSFATEALGPVDMATDPLSGDIFYVAITSNDILRIHYTGAGGNAAPVVVCSGTPEVGPAPLAVQFSSSGTFDPDGDAFSLGWDFGDGQGSTAANPAHTYTLPGTFVARLTADDHKGGISSNAVVVSVTGPSGFPTTTVVDNFNRPDGAIGGSWVGTTSGLVITGQQLAQTSGAADAVWNGAVFGPTQEAFVTLNAITAGSGTEHDLMLKIQGTSWSTGHIEVRYDATPGSITVSTYAPTQGWVTRGGPFTVTLAPGDRLGARTYPNGAVEVYRNGQLIASASAGNWPFVSAGGRIGLTLVGASQSRLDSFGGGDAVLDPNTRPTATIVSPVNGSFFYVGQNIALSGTGSDAQDPSSALTARWEVDIHHNNHIHPNAHQFTGFSATLVGENHDDGTGVYEEIRFIVTDTGGKSDTARVNIYPELDLSPSPLVLSPDPPASNASAQATFRLRNSGRMPVPISRWVLVVDGATAAQGDTIVPALDSVTIVRTLPALGVGNHVLRVVADTLGQAFETSESNNTTTRTVTPTDLNPPLFVTGPTATPGTTTALVAWTCNETSRGAVRFGLTPSLGDSMITAPGTSGSVTLTGLTRNTTYSYRVAITDATSLTTLSPLATFTTLANRPPVASAAANPASGPPPLSVQFSSAGSSDPDGDPLTFKWTFGDGDSSALASPSHVYAAAGAYVATLRVSDAFGGSDSKSVAISVGGAFPSGPVLDNFNRADAALAAPWTGDLAGMRVQGNRLVQTVSAWNTVIWNGATFGADQEGYVTLVALTAGSPEHDVLLKVQGTTASAAQIEVRYDHSKARVYVSTFDTRWRNQGNFAQTFVPGDRLGARALATGSVEVYRNTTLIGTVSVTSWPFYTQGGRIGLTIAQATASALDDFGGGTLVSGPDVTPPVFTAGPSVAPQTQSATVSWTTNELTTGVVRFGLTPALGDSVTSPSSLSHADVLPNLTRGTTYSYLVVARDATGNTTTSALASFATLANRPPVANATGVPTGGTAPLTVQFSSTGSSDPDGDAIQTSWAFGDGGTSTAPAPSHAYATAGTYNSILTVSDGLGGVGLDTVVVVVTPPGVGFPTTAVLDNFNRANGAPGASWADQVTRVAVTSNTLALTQTDATVVYAAASFGATQEAFVTLTSVAGIAERDLMLKVQGLSWSAGHIEVRYSPGSVTVSTYAPTGGWVTRGVFPVTMVAGDKLGARADAAGQVQLYRNATLLGTTSVGTWPFAAAGGRIGLTLAGATSSPVDDFGGGTVPGTAPSAPALALKTPGMELEGISRDMAWLSPPRPNPSARTVLFTLSLPSPRDLAWSVFDLQGRRLWSESGSFAGGLTTLSWNGQVAGRRAPAGMYLAIVDVDGRRLTRRFVRVE